MKLKGIEEDIMLKSGCANWKTTATGEEIIVLEDKDENYYSILDETAKLSTIRTSKWINFWSIFGIVLVVVGIFGGIVIAVM